jgi:hypothetical protein
MINVNRQKVYEGKDFPSMSLTDIITSFWTNFLNTQQRKEYSHYSDDNGSGITNEELEQCVTNLNSKSDAKHLCNEVKTSHRSSEEHEEEFELVEPMVFDLVNFMKIYLNYDSTKI